MSTIKDRQPLRQPGEPIESEESKGVMVTKTIPAASRTRYSEAKRTVRKTPRIRSEDQQEMIRIRKKLGFSQQQFATALAVNRDRIVNIENGRVAKVPKEMLRNAKQLLDDPEYLAQVERLRNTDMDKLLSIWWERLGIPNDGSMKSDRMGAQVLGVHINSIYRWRRGEVRPDMESLIRMEAAVEFMVNNLKSGAKALGEDKS